jgi:hypothetical protein
MKQVGEIYDRLAALEVDVELLGALDKKVDKLDDELRDRVIKLERQVKLLKRGQTRDARDIDRLFERNGWSTERPW